MGVSAIPPERSLIIWHPLDTPPPGYVKANAPEVSRAAYAWAFAKYGTKYGAGDGVNTFILGPDLRGEFPRGWDDGRGVDPGRGLGTWQLDMFKEHSHEQDGYAVAGAGGVSVGVTSGQKQTGKMGGSETRPRNVAGLFCIAIAP